MKMEEIAVDNQFSKFQADLFDTKNFPKLLDAEEIAPKIHLKPERLLNLAEAGVAPCIRIDGGKPRFLRIDVMEWAAKNLVHVQEARNLPDKFAVLLEAPKPDLTEIPKPLLPMADKISILPNYWIPPCVYFLCSEGKIMYIGQTIALNSRIDAHKKDKKDGFDRILWIQVPEEMLLSIENSYIKLLHPPWNGVNSRATPKSNPKEKHLGNLRENGYDVLVD